MDKKTIEFLKRKFPNLFFKVVKSPFLARFFSELDRGRYIYCLLWKRPYFGTVALAGQTWEERKTHMKRIVTQEIKNNKKKHFNLLEIGSWAGNSAVLWADAIKSSRCAGTILCVDPWEPYVNNKNREKVNVATMLMNNALKKEQVFKLFLHNVKASGHTDIIHPIKGPSDHILPFLSKENFDLVYVDGDHSYSGIKKDLLNASVLVREGGILCGDDMDLSIDQIDLEYAHQHKEINMVIDPKTKQTYHPGVCLAVSEFFGVAVSKFNGFWAMRKTGSGWETVNYKEKISKHTP